MDGTAINYEDFGSVALEERCITRYARKKGRSHAENGTVCQDYCLAENIDSETQVVCIADGHGGEVYSKSEIGAKLACETFCDLIKRIKVRQASLNVGEAWLNVLKTRYFKDMYLQSWRKAVVDHYISESEGCSETEVSIVKKYGTTFLFVVYTDAKLAIGQLGDGAILLFNDYGQCQLFKRHKVKTSSHTSSLASNRAEYAFTVDIYDRSMYSYALLSTDGIYDKLDNDDSFLLYAKSLIAQIDNDKAINKPFYVEGIDVSEISKDDCTIAIMAFEKKAPKYELINMGEYGYEDIVFKRSLAGVEVYEAVKDGKQYELHVVNGDITELDLDLKSCLFIKSDLKIPLLDGRAVYVYSVSNSWLRVNELIECGEHLEKKYWFNDSELSLSEDEKYNIPCTYSNEYWLDFYEKILQIGSEFDIINILFHQYAFESVFITEDEEIAILSDAIYQPKRKGTDSNYVFNNFLENFSIIGKISCGSISLPLFECTAQGQNIVMLHALLEKKPLCRVIFNREKKMLGLWNATNKVWKIEEEKRKEVPVQGVLRLNKNQVFLVRCDEKKIAQGAEFVDGYARYQIDIFKENT